MKEAASSVQYQKNALLGDFHVGKNYGFKRQRTIKFPVLFISYTDTCVKVKLSHYRPGQAQRVPGS